MLASCWFTLWTSSRFLYPYILLISLEIFLFSCLWPFFFSVSFKFLMLFEIGRITYLFDSTIGLVCCCCMLQDCTAYEPRPLWFRDFCMAVILSGMQQNDDTTRAYSVSCSSKTQDANMRSPYGDTLQVCLVTCVLRNHNNGVKHLADNCS